MRLRFTLRLFRHLERTLSNRLADRAAANALSADTHRFRGTTSRGYLDTLQVGFEFTACDPGDLGTDTT